MSMDPGLPRSVPLIDLPVESLYVGAISIFIGLVEFQYTK